METGSTGNALPKPGTFKTSLEEWKQKSDEKHMVYGLAFKTSLEEWKLQHGLSLGVIALLLKLP